MKIRMLTNENGSLDGIRVEVYSAGIEYDLTDSPGALALAAAFVGARMAVEVVEEAQAEPRPVQEFVVAADPVAEIAPPEPAVHSKPGRKSKRQG